jgi:hypothetical protein
MATRDAKGTDAPERELELLMVEARPIMDTVLARFLRSETALRRDELDDVLGTVALRLVRKLREAADEITDFENYVATLTYHTIYDFMRRRYPERTRLKNRLRYLLQHDRRLAMWRSGDVLVCGLSGWSGRHDPSDSFSIERSAATPRMRDAAHPHDAVAAIFERAHAPLTLEALVRVTAHLWDITEPRIENVEEQSIERLPSHAAQHETRQVLQTLWNEIRELPPAHRAALLLNLRDAEGVNAVSLFVLVGVARFEEIAEAAGLTPEELEQIWESLPIDDQAIASKLNITRQQVINLRRTARERLARRTLMFRYERRRG